MNATDSTASKRGIRTSPTPIVLFFGGFGAYFSVISSLASLGLDGLKSMGRGSFIPLLPSDAGFAIILATVAAALGAAIGALCSVAALPFLRRKRWARAALWLVPSHTLIVIIFTRLLMAPLSGRGWIVLLLAAGSFVFVYIVVSPILPNISVPGCCDGCGYSLRGNVSGVCPECGRSIEPEDTIP